MTYVKLFSYLEIIINIFDVIDVNVTNMNISK